MSTKSRVIIVDDEKGARALLENYLSKYCPQAEVIAVCDSAEGAYKSISTEKPDLVFLDIEMPNETGLQLLQRFDEIKFDLIFVTAFNHYAIKAIKYSAVDYLLKPIDIKELKEAFQKHLEKKSKHNPSEEQLKHLMDNLSKDKKTKKLAVPDNESIAFVSVEDIVRCESEGNYTRIFMETGKVILSSKTLAEYESLLQEEPFFRVHRSHLINLNKIGKFIKGDGGYLVMSDGSNVEVSRRKKQEFLDLLAGH